MTDFFDAYECVTDERGEPRRFETYGEDWRIVLDTDPSYVWTLVDFGEGTAIVAGRCHVNRIAYYITTTPWTDPCETFIDTIYEEN